MGFKISGRAQGGLKMIRGGRDTWTGEDGKVDGLQEGLLVGGEQRGGSEEAQVESRRHRRPTPPPPPPPALGVKRVQSCPTTLLPSAAPHRQLRDQSRSAPKGRPLFAPRRSKYLSRDIYYHYTNKGVTVGHGLPATRLSRSRVFGEEDSISVQAGFLMGKKIGRKNDDSTADPINCLFYKDRRERLFNAIVIRG